MENAFSQGRFYTEEIPRSIGREGKIAGGSEQGKCFSMRIFNSTNETMRDERTNAMGI